MNEVSAKMEVYFSELTNKKVLYILKCHNSKKQKFIEPSELKHFCDGEFHNETEVGREKLLSGQKVLTKDGELSLEIAYI